MSDCIFCKIVAGEIPSQKVFENERILAFRDINPAAPVHILIIPKTHRKSLNELLEDDQAVMGEICLLVKDLAKQEGVDESGYRLVVNTGKDGGQMVDHLHFHLLGGKALGVKLN